MSAVWMLAPVLLPIAAGLILLVSGAENRKKIHAATLSVACVNACLVWALILFSPTESVTYLSFTDKLTVTLRIDGLSKLFAGMISILWVFTSIYAFEYMAHEGREKKFFGFFLMTFGVVVGIAFAANLFTLYLFYEYLTFVTLPLVMHQMNDRARYAGKKYLIYSVSGGALVFVAMMILLNYGVSLDFTMGGFLNMAAVRGHETVVRVAFLISLVGFGVKSAIFPMHAWLPAASVAPTPVTALLHAVAVVKSGVFAIARMVFFSFGTAILAGSFAQNVMMIMAIVTIVYGSVMALRTSHLKRRLAYSTVSNLSYIVFGLSLMTMDGLTGAMLHMLFHAVIKIVLFFCVGAILCKTHAEYLDEIHGYGKRMPAVMTCYFVAGLGLIGIPPLGAFESKYGMATAAAGLGTGLAYAGIAALILSEILTALYIMQPVAAAFFPDPTKIAAPGRKDDPTLRMTLPIALLTAGSVVMAVFSGGLVDLIRAML